MTCPCTELGLDELFDEQFADKDARRYLRRGLPPRARLLLELIQKQIELRGRTALEGGAGAGAVSVELARRGAARAIGVDAMPAAVQRAQQLAREAGVGNAEFRQGDFADPALDPPAADLVILDRVVCCYPDWAGLLRNAARASRRLIALSYPPQNIVSRIEVSGLNFFQRILRRKFRLHLHSPAAMRNYLEQHGFVQREKRLFWIWEIAVYVRD